MVARVIANTDTATLNGFVHEAVSNKVSLLATDEHSDSRFLHRTFTHQIIRVITSPARSTPILLKVFGR